jgi:hypothetical protein
MQQNVKNDFTALSTALKGKRDREWTNLGGQLVPTQEVDRLRADIGTGALDTWDNIHRRYDRLWKTYPLAKQRHAYAVLCELLGTPDGPSKKQWLSVLDKAVKIQEHIRDQVYLSRKKDDDNPFRRATYRNPAEMKATVGTAKDNSFVHQVHKQTETFKEVVGVIRKRG